jgi:hypothetical protein
LNDVCREAAGFGVAVHGARAVATGDFDRDTWESKDIDYPAEIDSPASQDELDALLHQVDAVAEIPKAIRAGASVQRISEP